MGHSEAVNKNVYQCPAIATLLLSGKYLDNFDKGKEQTGTSAGPTRTTIEIDSENQMEKLKSIHAKSCKSTKRKLPIRRIEWTFSKTNQ